MAAGAGAAGPGVALGAALVAAALLMGLGPPPPAAALPACRISEFPCRTNKCIRLDHYCDGKDDCGDTSDEPPHCTVCNRTYYGDVGKTYELSIGKPALDRIPYNCHLTFTASGHTHGELIQLIFDEFHVGRYLKHAADEGCPDGHMTLAELGRPFTGGVWCGPSSGYTVYFSEVSTVTLSLRLFPTPAHATTPFRFHLRYRFITRDDAVVRFGSHDKLVERGVGVPGTYCSRQFDECYRKKCKLQSPNYPGMYPRNVTCLLNLRQKEVPHCKHAMISVHQNAEHKMKRAASAPASLNKTSRAVRVWDDCSGAQGERDYLVFYDGPSQSDPVLLRWCGGDLLPRVASRGPEMLVAFHSSAFSAPLHTLSPLRGFELEVDVLFSDSDSFDYQRDPRKCEFWINATSWAVGAPRSGGVLSPRHTLPPNTTCTYRFHGLPGDTVWVYFMAYSHYSLLAPAAGLPSVLATPATSTTTSRPPALHNHLLILPTRAPATPPPSPWIGLGGTRTHHRADASHPHLGAAADPPTTPSSSSCSMRLRIWDGGGTSGLPLLASHCDADGPRLCAHAALGNATRATRSCGPHESYESSGTDLTLQHFVAEGTALHPAHWRLKYEFVDTNLGGEPWTGRGSLLATGAVSAAGRPLSRPPIPCARLFRRLRSGEVFSPRNVFMFGRGGAANLSCIYRIEAASNERIRLTIDKAAFGESADVCSTVPDPHTARPTCAYGVGARTAELRLWEVPWRDVRLPRACLCDNATVAAARPFVYTSASRVLELTFTVSQLNVTEDFDNLHFHATFEMVRSNECSRKQRLRGAGGEIEFESPASSRSDLNCDGMPWMVEAHENKSLFLLTWGSFLPVAGPVDDSASSPSRCHTRSRILLYSGRPLRLLRVVCPLGHRERHFSLHVFSEEWFGLPAGQQLPAAPPGTLSYSAVAASMPGGPGGPGALSSPSFLVEWVGRDQASAALHWLEISRPKLALQQRLWSQTGEKGAKPPPELVPKGNSSLALGWDCPHKCPELNACISESLWCDGRPNCPSGFDEADPKCEYIGRRIFTWLPGGLYFAMASAGAGCVALLLGCLLLVLCRARARRRRLLAKQDNGLGYGGGSGVGTLSSVTSSRGTIGSRGSLSAGLSGGSLPGTYRRTKTRRRSDGTGRRLSGVDGDAIANQPRRVPTSELLLDANS
ncbi:uncharacterized protein LOC113206306 isoform X2 [Frankliniella occidentalis]|uniref:Uncharacterized protein LOC113206306 isoform X2 n=1 Tax=Frankliniella occidentalis TaxID=133901 RepID=A0A9C6U1N4_FRAOC|nr:uncharacterized protein LOC113206306 isoform X2 [Frankliniella occidentalis]